MTYVQIALRGGPHHRKTGWFHSQDGAPEVLYVSDQPSHSPMIVAEPASEWVHGPFHAYHLEAVDDRDEHTYAYDPQEAL